MDAKVAESDAVETDGPDEEGVAEVANEWDETEEAVAGAPEAAAAALEVEAGPLAVLLPV